jgi:hypothetical protein
LRAHDLPVVFFNAFQHQTERDLLAAVLQQIGDTVPSWWRPSGINFHRRLLAIRVVRRRRLLIGLAALVILISGYLVTNRNGSLIASIFYLSPGWEKLQQSGASVWLWMIAAAPVLALFISLAELLLKGRTLSGRVKRAELRRKRDFRGRVAADFRDIVEAFRPRILTLIIDSLDRCSPKQ